ncbi:MAG: hypothetical protein H7Y11_08760, partial [Armatimonadetes bacterium]|nr:hypothetical protein [Anaerolineae bacterium]
SLMQTTTTQTIFGIITDFLASNPSPEEIIAYRLPEALQSQAHALLARNTEGLLTFEEQQAMFDFMRIDEMMSMLKAKTRLKLSKMLE